MFVKRRVDITVHVQCRHAYIRVYMLTSVCEHELRARKRCRHQISTRLRQNKCLVIVLQAKPQKFKYPHNLTPPPPPPPPHAHLETYRCQVTSDEVSKSRESEKSVIFKERGEKSGGKIEPIRRGQPVRPKQTLELIRHLNLFNLNLSVFCLFVCF